MKTAGVLFYTIVFVKEQKSFFIPSVANDEMKFCVKNDIHYYLYCQLQVAEWRFI